MCLHPLLLPLVLFASFAVQAQETEPPPKPPTTTEAVTVFADRLDPEAPFHLAITREQIERIPSPSISAPLSSLITATSPGVAADSNGSFHPLGDHAEASFVLDGQPITDQQGRTFSSPISLNALESIEVREGAPQAGVGDKTSLVVVAHGRSGLDHLHPTGAVSFTRSSFASTQAAASFGVGTPRFGSFSAVDFLKTSRFLDTPELAALHADGNAATFSQRFDERLSTATSTLLNLSLSHAWFQTPNTYDQQANGQDQAQTIDSFNIAPALLHTFSPNAFSQTNIWLRQDKIRYRASPDPFADTPATLAQSRRLTSAGIRSELTYTRGRHNISAGAEWKHTLLAEQFSTGLTDSTYNSPCLLADGGPDPNTALVRAAQCKGAINPDFLENLVSIDLTRGGKLFNFRGRTDIKQEAVFATDSVKLRSLTLNLGLRADVYNGLTSSSGWQPRLGLAYSIASLRTVIRLAYSRVFITPYNENLIVASSSGPGSSAAELGANNSSPLTTGNRNQFNTGFETQLSQHVTLSAEYFWKFTYGAYDFDVLLNSPLTFPTQFRKSKLDGGLGRITSAPVRGFAGYATVSHVRSRLFGPEIGGVSFSAPYNDVARPDHDQGLASNVYVRYQVGKRGPWAGMSWRYDGGLVAVAVPTYNDVLRLTGDEQAQMGFHCGAMFATVARPIRSCATADLGSTRINIPPAALANADRNPSRIVPKNLLDFSVGQDNLFLRDRQRVGITLDVVNLTNNDGLYNFLSTFSGTHFITPRSVSVQLRYAF